MLSPRKAEQLLNALAAAEGFDQIADALNGILAFAWEQSGEQAVLALLEYLDGQPGRLTASMIGDMTATMEDIMGPQFANRVSPIVRETVGIVYGMAQEEIRAGMSASFNLPDRRAMTWLHEHEMYWTRTHFTREWTERIANLSEVAIKNGLSRHDAGLFFQDTLGEAFAGESQQYWELVADAITTRSRSFGSIEAFQKAGITQYRIDAVIDHRTSEICKYLDGEEIETLLPDGTVKKYKLDDVTFSTADAVATRDAMIAAKSPEDAKEIMPWKSPSFVLGKSTGELASSGIMMPPFHGRCRSRLVII